jgi:hypothetical protein
MLGSATRTCAGLAWLLRSEVTNGEADMARDPDTSPGSTMAPARCRPFRVSDAMILVIGASLTLAAGSHLLRLMGETLGRLLREAASHQEDLIADWPVFWRYTHDHLRNTLWYGFQFAGSLLIGMTPVFLVLRLRRPRPAWRALLRQPGTAAALAMVFGLFWGTGCLLTAFPERVDPMTAAPAAIGGSVGAAWLILALGRRWDPEPGWIDRLGRILGCIAIATALIGLVVYRI